MNVEKLRELESKFKGSALEPIFREAADEIVKLRAEVTRLRRVFDPSEQQ